MADAKATVTQVDPNTSDFGITGSKLIVNERSGELFTRDIYGQVKQIGGGSSFVQSGTGAATRTMQEKGRDLVSIDDYSGATDAIKHTAAEAAMGTRTALFSRRFASDGLPNTENGAGWFRLEYADPVTSSPRAIDLSFYGFGEILRFTGDGTTANNSRSVLELWGADGVGPTYRPIMTLVVSSTEHEVHVARDQSDVDAIICSYMPTGGPVIYTEAAQSATLDFGVQRLRKFQVNTTNLSLVSGHILGWTNSTTNPGATADTTFTRISAGKLAFQGGDAELLVNCATALSAAGYGGVRASGTTGGFYDLMTTTTRIGTIYNDATYAIAIKSTSGTLPVGVLDSGGAEQVRFLMTASATRYITLTGSNAGNPTIGTSAGRLNVSSALTLASLGAFAASDKYLIVDSSGNVHVSALGPAS